GATERFQCEAPLRLRRCGWCYQPWDAATEGGEAPGVGPLPALARQGQVTFASLNKPLKHTPQVAALWAAVLHAVPGSRLMLLSHDATGRDRAAREMFHEHG